MVHNGINSSYRLQVGRLDQALILRGLALLSVSSASVSSIFMVLTLPFGELNLVGLALNLVD